MARELASPASDWVGQVRAVGTTMWSRPDFDSWSAHKSFTRGTYLVKPLNALGIPALRERAYVNIQAHLRAQYWSIRPLVRFSNSFHIKQDARLVVIGDGMICTSNPVVSAALLLSGRVSLPESDIQLASDQRTADRTPTPSREGGLLHLPPVGRIELKSMWFW
jgi:hypothetical protein